MFSNTMILRFNLICRLLCIWLVNGHHKQPQRFAEYSTSWLDVVPKCLMICLRLYEIRLEEGGGTSAVGRGVDPSLGKCAMRAWLWSNWLIVSSVRLEGRALFIWLTILIALKALKVAHGRGVGDRRLGGATRHKIGRIAIIRSQLLISVCRAAPVVKQQMRLVPSRPLWRASRRVISLEVIVPSLAAA
jgi:hypothetical protein